MTVFLDRRGDIAIVEIVAYVPILIASGFLVTRHGFTRKAGWSYLVALSIINIVGGGLTIAAERNLSDGNLNIAANALASAGLSSLLLSTIGFLRTVCEYSLDEDPLVSHGMLILSVLCAAGLAFTIIGYILLGNARSLSALSTATTLRRIGAVLVAVLIVAIFILHVVCWNNKHRILKARRTLLTGISLALPFLVIRVIYSVLGAWAPLVRGISDDGSITVNNSSTSNSLSNFSPITGNWVLYLLMSVLAEYIAVVIYVVVGTRTPLDRDTQMDYAPSASLEYQEERDRLTADGSRVSKEIEPFGV